MEDQIKLDNHDKIEEFIEDTEKKLEGIEILINNAGITLDNYISTDPISQHNQKLYDIKVNKLKIMIELKKLKGLL